jgi:hypothetical protein
MVDDPVLQLEHALRKAATRRRPRRLWLAAPALAAAAAVALLAGREPSLTALAAQHLSNGIVYLKTDTRTYDGRTLNAHNTAELWYRGTRERSLATSLGPKTGRVARSLEVVRDARTITSYESGANTLTTQAVCHARPALDPVTRLRTLKLRERGTATFDGKRVARLVATDGPQQLTYLVTPKTGEPVALRVRLEGQITLTRFLAHDDGLTDPALLRMRPHPGAKRIDLGRSRC